MFLNEDELITHMKKFHCVTKFYCKHCQQFIDDFEKKDEHNLLHTKKHFCAICNKPYYDNWNYKRHVKKFHKYLNIS